MTAAAVDADGPRFPNVHVRRSGEDGNAVMVIGLVGRALRRAGVDQADRDAFAAEAMSGDFDNVLRTAMRWVVVS